MFTSQNGCTNHTHNLWNFGGDLFKHKLSIVNYVPIKILYQFLRYAIKVCPLITYINHIPISSSITTTLLIVVFSFRAIFCSKTFNMFRGAAYHVVKSRSKRHMLFGFLHLNFGIFDEKEGNLNPKIHVYVGFCYFKNSPKYLNVKYVCGLLEFRIKFILVLLVRNVLLL